MAIPMNSICMLCQMNKHVEEARKLDPDKAEAFTKDLLEILKNALGRSNSAMEASSINKLYQRYFGLEQDRFVQEKKMSNEFIKSRLDGITRLVEAQADPVFAALQFAVLGNYLDFAALHGQVSFEKLDAMLEDALNMPLDPAVYENLCRDLETAKKLLYVTDNAGEIGFDKVLALQLQKKYPQLQITFCVRGLPVHNDATREDAAFMELEFEIIDTGNDVGGVEFSLLSAQAKQAFDTADVVLAKGMGNTESMYGCGYNIYYAFLVKCVRFAQYFDKPLMTPMLIR